MNRVVTLLASGDDGTPGYILNIVSRKAEICLLSSNKRHRTICRHNCYFMKLGPPAPYQTLSPKGKIKVVCSKTVFDIF